MRQIQFPDNDVVTLVDGMTFTVAVKDVSVNLGGSAVKTFTCRTVANALALQRQIQSVPTAADGTVTVLHEPALFTLTSVLPSPFNVVTDPVTIRGTGFDLGTPLILWVEDSAGGQDSNGYSMTCAYVNPTTLTAVYRSAGDGALGAGDCLLYLQDAAGNQSVVLPGTVDGSLNVTPANLATLVQVANSVGMLSYKPVRGGSDSNANNANINGDTVYLYGAGFTPGMNGSLVNGTDVIPVTFKSGGTLTAALPAYAAGTIAFDYQYTDAQGVKQKITSAISITFS